MQIGNWQVDLINDCWLRLDGGGAFGLVPKVLWQKHLPADEDNLVPFSSTCLLLRGYGHVALIDTGLGYKMPPKMQNLWRVDRSAGGLIETLQTLGLQPHDVDTVICTHLHSDHAGGNTKLDEQGRLAVSFPNATYFVQEREYQDAMQPNERTRATYNEENYRPLMDQGLLTLLDGDAEILPGVEGIVTRGHTPGHMCVRISDGEEHLVFVCDLASLAVHFENLAWMAAYDVEPLHSLENKKTWRNWAIEHQAFVVFPHDVNRPVCRASIQEDKFVLQTLNERWVNG